MRHNFNHILFAIGLSLTASAGFPAVYAQDAGFPVSDSYEPESSDDVSTYSPGEGEPRNTAPKASLASPTASKDSVALSGKSSQRTSKSSAEASKNAAKPEQDSTSNSKQEQKDEDDSVLSFNFLYYIFQKYKLQDIVD